MLPLVHGLRGIAALLVVLFHAVGHIDRNLGAPFLQNYFRFGDAGVQFFFVLSGFIIYYASASHLGQPKMLGTYLLKRGIRVYVPYWLVIIPLFFLYTLFPYAGYARHRDFSYFLSSLSLLPNSQGQYLVVAWTLTYEVVFYGIFSLVILQRRLLWGVVGGLFVLGTIRLFGPRNDFWFNPNWCLFALGIIAGWIARRGYPKEWKSWLMGVGGALLLVAVFLHVGVDQRRMVPAHDWSVFRYGLGSALLLLGAYYSSLKFGENLGDGSYSIYLTHIPLIAVLSVLFEKIGYDWSQYPIISFVLFVCLACIFGIFFAKYIEIPLVGLLRRRATAST